VKLLNLAGERNRAVGKRRTCDDHSVRAAIVKLARDRLLNGFVADGSRPTFGLHCNLVTIPAENTVNALICTALGELDAVAESRVEFANESLELCAGHCAHVMLIEHAIITLRLSALLPILLRQLFACGAGITNLIHEDFRASLQSKRGVAVKGPCRFESGHRQVDA
jgi:hypothetical protein